MNAYVVNYKKLPFEPIQIEYRRKLVLKQIHKHMPLTLMEVGCGLRPLFIADSLDFIHEFIVVEPASLFYKTAKNFAATKENVKLFNLGIEELDNTLVGTVDMIIVGCVLHELSDKKKFLSAIKNFCHERTIVHINVPNANSFHRRLAVAMGIIESATEQSKTQKNMQQSNPFYDLGTLHKDLFSFGFQPMDSGGVFLKPFTHGQMQSLVDSGFMVPAMLDGLDQLGILMPEYASEIWCNYCLSIN